ncbi:hypothetical protein ONS95_001396 [Cadophora gregata]|uniref:uncharacterized protein n=1 Tax=Cadophora gregata TaxID=51156 RepID=UPI0026DC79AF|nr:uncharacterized protein ONS95_001396 [Cadophora gregata]KAK0111016.1 hypothetical protein ONS95_001396 [Cadophora gregata]KAK0112527.1 hypothetical protein ONS96_001763 [Cadophora gregata f. sp. sojae]
MKEILFLATYWCYFTIIVSSQSAQPLRYLPQLAEPTPLHAQYKRIIPIPDSTASPGTTETSPSDDFLLSTPASSPSTPLPNLTLNSQIFTAAPPETVFLFSGTILAESHPITLSLTSKSCTLNPIISITASITHLPELGIISPGVTSTFGTVRCMVFGSGGRSSTYSAQGTGGWGDVRGRPGLVWTFTDALIPGGQTTQNPWESGTALWINPIPTTVPRFVVEGNRTVQFGGTVTLRSEVVSVTTDERGTGWLVAGKASATVPGWPLITKGPVLGSEINGAYPLDGMAAGGAQLIETGCCSICRNASQATTATTKSSGGRLTAEACRSWDLWLSVWALAVVVVPW